MSGSDPFSRKIGAVVLAAGMSTRMGQPKLALPWGNRTVIGQVVAQLIASGVDEIHVVAGGDRDIVAQALQGYPVELIDNLKYANGEMLDSFQAGLKHTGSDLQAILVVLGDQPQIQVTVVK